MLCFTERGSWCSFAANQSTGIRLGFSKKPSRLVANLLRRNLLNCSQWHFDHFNAVKHNCVTRIVAMCYAHFFIHLLVITGMLHAHYSVQADDRVASEKDTAIHVPTPAVIVAKMLEVAKVTKDDLLYDLGCGDGRIVIAAASKYGCRAVGYDIDERKVEESKVNVQKNRVEKLVQIECQDIFKLDLQPATVITLFLLPEMNIQLIPQLDKMKDGSRVVCHEFALRDVEHDRKLTITTQPDGVPRDIYLYTLPLKKVPAR
jgi:precorrin-6B methylase 2